MRLSAERAECRRQRSKVSATGCRERGNVALLQPLPHYSTWRLEVQHQLRSSELALLPASPALDATVKVFPRLL
jgi:hypothetical protein